MTVWLLYSPHITCSLFQQVLSLSEWTQHHTCITNAHLKIHSINTPLDADLSYQDLKEHRQTWKCLSQRHRQNLCCWKVSICMMHAVISHYVNRVVMPTVSHRSLTFVSPHQHEILLLIVSNNVLNSINNCIMIKYYHLSLGRIVMTSFINVVYDSVGVVMFWLWQQTLPNSVGTRVDINKYYWTTTNIILL